MRTAYFLTTTTRIQHSPQVNQFEQVSSLGHQMSLQGEPGLGASTGWSHVQRGGQGWEKESSEVQCSTGNGHIGPLPFCEQTDTTENITFQQLRWRAVKME